MHNSILPPHQSGSMQKPLEKNINYSRHKTILKIGHFARAIAFAKFLVWVKNHNSKKHAEIDSTTTLE